MECLTFMTHYEKKNHILDKSISQVFRTGNLLMETLINCKIIILITLICEFVDDEHYDKIVIIYSKLFFIQEKNFKMKILDGKDD